MYQGGFCFVKFWWKIKVKLYLTQKLSSFWFRTIGGSSWSHWFWIVTVFEVESIEYNLLSRIISWKLPSEHSFKFSTSDPTPGQVICSRSFWSFSRNVLVLTIFDAEQHLNEKIKSWLLSFWLCIEIYICSIEPKINITYFLSLKKDENSLSIRPSKSWINLLSSQEIKGIIKQSNRIRKVENTIVDNRNKIIVKSQILCVIKCCSQEYC